MMVDVNSVSNVFCNITDKDAAISLATAFVVAHSHADVFTALRYQRRRTGQDYTRYLMGGTFGSHGPGDFENVDLFDIRDQANAYLELRERRGLVVYAAKG